MIEEEARLKALKNDMDRLDLPSQQLDFAIQKGMQHVKRRKKRIRWLTFSTFAAIFVLSFITLLYSSPSFASYVAKIPILKEIVELTKGDKGLQAALENKYVEKIDKTQTKKGISVTIDSVIKDESGIILFYSIISDQDRDEISLTDIRLSKELEPYSSLSNTGLNVKKNKRTYHEAQILFPKSISTNTIPLSFTVSSKGYKESFSFNLALIKSNAIKKVYDIDKTVQLEGQKLTIKSVTMQPLRTDIEIERHADNEKTILDVSDLRIENEKGEVWKRIENGITASGWDHNTAHYYLQSNYFKEAKQLYVVLNKAEALKPEQMQLVIDTSTNKILQAPDNYIQSVTFKNNEFTLQLNPRKDFYADPLGTITDANGKEIVTDSSYIHSKNNMHYQLGVMLKRNQSFTNPLKIQLNNYPLWIKGDIKVRIK